MSTLIIAEVGVNHNGNLNEAFKLIKEAKSCGADFVKFQIFKSENLVDEQAEKAPYQQKNMTDTSNSQFEMLKKLELSFEDFVKIKEECEINNIRFMASAFDLESLNFLLNQNCDYVKIPSGEIGNVPYLREFKNCTSKIILSTGMSTIQDIEFALEILKSVGVDIKNISLLHCTSNYPCGLEEINMNSMVTIRKRFGLDVGYSDHSNDNAVSNTAVAMGASIIEKHFTLDNQLEGPDHKASLNVEDFKKFVKSIRKVEKILGSSAKKPTNSEMETKRYVEKKIFASKQILKGEKFSDLNMTTKRSKSGINSRDWDLVCSKEASKDFQAGDLIEIE